MQFAFFILLISQNGSLGHASTKPHHSSMNGKQMISDKANLQQQLEHLNWLNHWHKRGKEKDKDEIHQLFILMKEQ